jgi:hypothetical protein
MIQETSPHCGFGSLRRFLFVTMHKAIAACRQCIAAGPVLTDFQPLQKQIFTVYRSETLNFFDFHEFFSQ